MIVFMACDCTVWPLDADTAFGRCGACDVRPHTFFDPPLDGKAHPLEWFLEEEADA